MATVNVRTTTTATVLTPWQRILRTVLQTVIAFGVAEPTLIGGLGLTGATATKVAAIVGGLVLGASTLQNFLEHLNVLPTTGATAGETVVSPAPTPVAPVVSPFGA